jgi:YfiH family protein
MTDAYLKPLWAAPDNVRSLISTRKGGFSSEAYEGFNLALHVGDDPEIVIKNRQLLRQELPSEPVWLNQVHGTQVFDVDEYKGGLIDADAAVTSEANRVLTIMTADCLPVLFSDLSGNVVGVAHAGWRGLCAGVLENTIKLMRQKLKNETAQIVAYLGPAIGPTRFEVGQDVFDAFVGSDDLAAQAFIKSNREGKYMANLYLLARQRLIKMGVIDIQGGRDCTYLDSRFYSYRRNSITGRMASCIWIKA